MIGDGGFVFSLEKRGYVKAGPWTPEAAVEHPEAGNEFEMQMFYDNAQLYFCIRIKVSLIYKKFLNT